MKRYDANSTHVSGQTCCIEADDLSVCMRHVGGSAPGVAIDAGRIVFKGQPPRLESDGSVRRGDENFERLRGIAALIVTGHEEPVGHGRALGFGSSVSVDAINADLPVNSHRLRHRELELGELVVVAAAACDQKSQHQDSPHASMTPQIEVLFQWL